MPPRDRKRSAGRLPHPDAFPPIFPPTHTGALPMNDHRSYALSIFTLPILMLALVLSATAANAQIASLTGGGVPDRNINAQAAGVRSVPAEQQNAAADFTTKYGSQTVIRWDDFSGALDTVMDFKTSSSATDPASAALAFIRSNAALFGVSDTSTLKLSKSETAAGGYVVRYEQYFQGARVQGGGIGVVLTKSKQVVAAFGPYYAVSGVSTSAAVPAADAVIRAQADLAPFAVPLSGTATDLMAPLTQKFEGMLGHFKSPSPELTIFPTADGYRLAWDFFLYSRNPFGVYRYSVDAQSGEILSRESQVRAQATGNLVPATGDIFPTHPGIDKN